MYFKYLTILFVSSSIAIDNSNCENSPKKEIQLKDLDPIINLNDFKEKNFYFKDVLKQKIKFLFYIGEFISYGSLVFLNWKKIFGFEKTSFIFFLICNLLRIPISFSKHILFYNTYRNLFIYGANSIAMMIIIVHYSQDIPSDWSSGFYGGTVISHSLMTIILSIYNRKLYEINIKTIIEELQPLADKNHLNLI